MKSIFMKSYQAIFLMNLALDIATMCRQVNIYISIVVALDEA